MNGDGEAIAARPLVLRACQDSDGVRALRGFLHELGVPEAVTTDSPAIWRGQLPTLPRGPTNSCCCPTSYFCWPTTLACAAYPMTYSTPGWPPGSWPICGYAGG